MATNWTDELRAKAIEEYIKLSPTPETSAECIKEVATALGNDVTANGVRAILVKAGEYVPSAKSAAKSATGAAKTAAAKTEGAARVSKESAVAELVAAINDTGTEPDMDIISKLTGKAALYFAGVLRKSQAGE